MLYIKSVAISLTINFHLALFMPFSFSKSMLLWIISLCPEKYRFLITQQINIKFYNFIVTFNYVDVFNVTFLFICRSTNRMVDRTYIFNITRVDFFLYCCHCIYYILL